MADQQQKLTAQQLKAIALLSTGAKQISVVEQLGVGRSTIQRWLKDSAFVAELNERIDESKGDALRQLQALHGEAVTTLRLLMNDPDVPPHVRSQIAWKILEHTAGKSITVPFVRQQNNEDKNKNDTQDPAIELFRRISGTELDPTTVREIG